MKIEKYRDIQLIENSELGYLAIACDVSAGIGSKDGDVVQIEPDLAGYYATAVTLIELMSIGAEPMSVINTLGVEMDPTGKEVIEGIKNAMSEANIPLDCLTGSTEDNMPSLVTSIGITVVSNLDKDKLKTQSPASGQKIYLVGLPKMGQRYLEDEVIGKLGEVMDIKTTISLRAHESVIHMLPIGSKGIKWELNLLSSMYGLEYILDEDVPVDLGSSGGPASCMIVTSEVSLDKFKKLDMTQPITYVGYFV